MKPADEMSPAELVGKRIAFRHDEGHARCWHSRNGLTGGVVLRPALTLSQKAELLATEDVSLPESLPDEADIPPRVWVRADPCPSFPRGCEAAVELDCLLVESQGRPQ